MNTVIIVGNMTDEPQITEVSGGHKKATFSLALNRIKDGADYPRVTAWDKRAELIENWCHKGTKLAIRGHIHTDSYENRDGKKVYTTEIVVDELEFCDKKPKEQPKETSSDEFMKIPDGTDAEIPFK